MRIAVSSTGTELDARLSPVFGRCPTYLFVDSETMQFESMPNPAMSASGGAGIQAAQFIVSQGVQAVISGNLGPNAFQVLAAAGVTMYTADGGTAREAVKALLAGRLARVSAATAAAHSGMGRRGGRGGGQGRRRGGVAGNT
jgi:predicted Fe-Mo cluster-binding NifX family protein